MQKDLPIYEGFADGLNALNQEVVSDMMAATPVGRGYKSGSGVYLSQVHIVSLGEARDVHLQLAEDLGVNSGIFGGRVYMGGAGLLNFSFIAAARPAAAILFDINAAQKMFWDDAIEALAKNPKIEGFLEFLIEERKSLYKKLSETFNEGAVRFFSKNDPSRDYAYRNGSSLEQWIRDGQVSPTADTYWMKKGYEHLHLLAKHRAVGAVTLDVTDKEACQHLKRYLDAVRYRSVVPGKTQEDRHLDFNDASSGTGAKVGMIYISNILKKLYWAKGFTDPVPQDATPKAARKNLELLLDLEKPMIIGDYPEVHLSWPTCAMSPEERKALGPFKKYTDGRTPVHSSPDKPKPQNL